MPQTTKQDQYDKLRRLFRGYGLTATALSRVLGVSFNTAKKRLNDPKTLTLGELAVIARRAHIPVDEIRGAVLR